MEDDLIKFQEFPNLFRSQNSHSFDSGVLEK
jgi:hypothetical protein